MKIILKDESNLCYIGGDGGGDDNSALFYFQTQSMASEGVASGEQTRRRSFLFTRK